MAGPKTDNAISMIENGMEKQETFQVDAIFYKRSGAARMFQIQCIPIRNHKEEIIFYTVHLHEPELKSPMRRDGPGRFGMFSRSSRQTNPEECNEDMLRIPERESKTGPDVKLLDTSSQSVPAYIILHYGTFKQIWGWFILLLP
ncbi:Oidioi.mRNA.OKI2018_I69.PAR.g13105.t1.cds [Oikopleura dioica]|uniref:Oidioi.mRNA.OKI2018_I69.PAR.g13105.t1.cds n=1 Tax=Oikopleura dioica TaxID=34765 RepID=A0ABN7S7Q1_OIKDI|nr:Oidioi.mRNA.OKI2018_I69.PAR.g13105.t1.cds [Oikopleura dioica]